MTQSVTLDARQRQALLDRYRKDRDPDVRFRAHILLLLADGHTWATVCTLLFCVGFGQDEHHFFGPVGANSAVAA